MKLTKFSALAFASIMALASCSKEEAKNPGMPDLLPGEARIVLNLSGNGATTYSTSLAETAIKSANAKLFDVTTGDSIVLTDRTFNPTTKTFSATVSSADATAKKNVVMYLYVNGIAVDATGGTAQVNHENATVATVIDRELTNGAPAGLKSEIFELKEGQNIVKGEASSVQAKRAIARVAVSNASKGTATPMSITGFEITFDKINLTTGGKMYGGRTNESTNTVVGETSNHMYTVGADGLQDVAGSTGLVETVAYMYPSSLVTATIKAPSTMGGKTRTIAFLPGANKNYLIKITPTQSGSSVDFTVAIDATWQGNDELEADFGSTTKLKPATTYTSNGVTVVDVKTLKVPFISTGNTKLANIGDLFPAYKAEIGAGAVQIKFEAKGGPGEVSSKHLTSTEVEMAHAIVYSANDFLRTVTVSAINPNGDIVLESTELNFVFTGKGLPAGFMVNMGGKEFMALATQGSGNIDHDVTAFNAVNALNNGGTTFNEKLEIALKTGEGIGNDTFAGKAFTTGGYCPVGTGRPSVADYKLLVGNVNHTPLTGFLYGLKGTQAHEEMHPLVDVDGNPVVNDDTKDRTVGRFAATAPAGTSNTYSKVAYKGDNVLFFFSLPTAGDDGKYIASDGSFHFAGKKSIRYIGAVQAASGLYRIRCVKQNNDRIIW